MELTKNMKRRDRRRRNAIAKDLRTPKYKQRIVERKNVDKDDYHYCPDCGGDWNCDCTRLVRQGLLPSTGLRSDLEGDQGDSNDGDRDSKQEDTNESNTPEQGLPGPRVSSKE